MNKILILAFILGCFLCASCSEEKKRINESISEEGQSLEPSGESLPQVTFFQYEDSSRFPDAILELYTPLGNQIFKPGKVPFEFNVKNYTLEKGGGGEAKLFMILNGGDPIGYFAPIFQRELTVGTYRAVAYLVDEDGLALKNFGNYVDRDFMVGDSRAFPYSAEPYLALNFPRNAQILKLGDELVVDFLVLGGDMNLDRLKVKISVNEHTYEIDHMAPIRVTNLPKGDYQVKVQLLRVDNKELEGPFSTITKTVFVR
ncbi:MAG: hypothetical protein ACK4SF_12910 [Algoriphagus aquaeductus]|uniref:Uncharacterized protein n=1 Tax=Algoriphagus aquaeductus TaxID=475299 RepID=A0A326RNF7_9BACT|nr:MULTISPECIES: hypothetical protein [Algoriphagus]PZV78522.1 hypothetical protein CLV31_11730 [Algoriphagus aquaeductus]